MINNAEVAEKRLIELKSKVGELKTAKIEEKIRDLTEENKVLESKIESTKAELIKLETANGKKQYPIPSKCIPRTVVQESIEPSKDSLTKKTKAADVSSDSNLSKKKEKGAGAVNDAVIDIRKLDFRIGKIIDINKHPDADSLYVEQVDCGEDKARTVVSGLVKFIPMEELKNKMVVILCNLKPVKMRGITSEAMVMCASSPEKIEVLEPPAAAVPGDLVHCEGFPREPESVLNPKKKIFEACAPDLMTNNDKVACYKGSPLVVPGKGHLLAPTLKGVNIK
ncbi:unnamed protein product [Arctia plantaginis]|uniref:tRNA-binding domain-containing protein n=1 Tax=Arctia plantaginis TaxID=874455 RepID=A0A8S0Z492_ARCPL|nr:unnamed protein product [Arctia plantaginis]CAB3254856.1 unnamed protein product [Arctia plantaginis]